MRQSQYLNVILTVNAVLLGGLLWTHIADSSALVQTASAQSPGTGTGVGIPNAADQRQKMLEALRELKASVDSSKKLLEGGKLKVEVTNLDQIKRIEVSNIEQMKK